MQYIRVSSYPCLQTKVIKAYGVLALSLQELSPGMVRIGAGYQKGPSGTPRPTVGPRSQASR